MSDRIEVLEKVNDELIEVMHMTGKKNFSYKCNQEKFSFALEEAIVSLKQKDNIQELLAKEEREADRILAKLRNKEQQGVDWDKWWELRNSNSIFDKKFEAKRLINAIWKLMK